MPRTDEQRFWEKVDRRGPDECWNWTASVDTWGYGQLRWKGPLKRASRVAWELSFGAIPNKLFVLHKCDNRTCVNPLHLFLGTHQDNMDDMVQKGRQSHHGGTCGPRGTHHSMGGWKNPNPLRGEQVGSSKLKAVDVDEIFRLFSTGNYSRAELGRMFGVCGQHVGEILSGIKWSHLTDAMRKKYNIGIASQ